MKHAQIPVIHYDDAAAREAYLAHIALLTQEIQDPTLEHNAAWARLRAISLEQFEQAFEGKQ